MKFLIRFIFTLIILLLLSVGGLYVYLYWNSPKYSGEITLKGLKNKVETYFDDYGIPHIYAQNEEDAYFALGYIHAQERLFQMEMIRRVAGGNLSEILGKDFVQTDKMMRTTGINEYAEKSAKKNMAENAQPYQKAANAYLNGVNYFLKNGSTPIEFTLLGIPKRDFTPKDIYLTMGYMAFSFANGFRTDPLLTKIKDKLGKEYLEDLAIDYQTGTEKIPVFKSKSSENKTTNDSLPIKEITFQNHHKAFDVVQIAQLIDKIVHQFPVPLFEGSNSWVLGAAKSKSNQVLFCNDPHIQYAQPAVWFEAHLEYPENSLYGHFLAGVPFANIAHNRNAAWGATMLQNDDVNFYREKINPQNKNQYWATDKWEDFNIREEIIQVKGQNPEKLQIKSTRNGVIVNDVIDNLNSKEPIAVYWTLTQVENLQLQMAYQLAKIKSLEEMKSNASKLHAPGLNLMYGDKNGNIAWFAAAKYIKHPQGVNTKFFLDGASGKESPLGFYDFSTNPSAENPPLGFVYSANNQPDTSVNMLYQGYYASSDRAKRIRQYLDKNKKFDTSDMAQMLTDHTSPAYPDLLKLILKNIQAKTENQKKAMQLLQDWNGAHNLEAVAPVVYNRLQYFILKNVYEDELGKSDFELFLKLPMMKHSFPKLIQDHTSVWWDDFSTKNKKESNIDILQKSFEESITALENQLGKNPMEWQWKKVHILTHLHPLGRKGGILGWIFNINAGGIMGGNEVLNISSFTHSADDIYPVAHGASMRILIDFADLENAQNIIPTGQSGNIMSPHYKDQVALYNAGKFRKMMMNEKEIKQSKHRKLIMKN